MYLADCFSSFRGERSCSSSSNPKSQMDCYPNLNKMEIMMNNLVLMFSPTDEKTPYEQGEKRTVIRFGR